MSEPTKMRQLINQLLEHARRNPDQFSIRNWKNLVRMMLVDTPELATHKQWVETYLPLFANNQSSCEDSCNQNVN